MRTFHLVATLFIAAALTAGGVYAAREITAPAPPSLAVYAPTGALLAIESTDFTALLKSWNNSAEQRRWLTGDDYAAFSRSRLFGRLGAAQSEFATAAGLAPDSQFLEQVAGTQSIFAWYDIGNLEFLYITRLPAGQAARMPLLALRDKFEERQAGGVTFYIRNSEDAASAAPGAPAAASDDGDNSRPRTVAFAVRGDLLLLATREDLVAGALEQMAHPGGRSLATDSWYAASAAAANEKPGDLRLTLDLGKITRSPYFRTYWIQQNITATHRYTAALSDLYREPGVFREERFLLLSNTAQPSVNTDLTPVLHFLPPGMVYRAVANPSAEDALAVLVDKLLAHTAANIQSPHQAPAADLSIPVAGDPSDLDDRIDTVRVPTDARASALAGLQSLLNTNAPVAMLSVSSAAAPDASRESQDRSNIFSAIHTGIVLATKDSCDAAAWQHDLTAVLSPRISVGDAGLHWREQPNAKVSWFRLDGSFPLAFAAEGNNCLLASDPGMLLAMLSAGDASAVHQNPATSIAGFNHAVQRSSLLKLVALLDRRGGSNANAPGEGKPPFFSGNVASLSNTFEDLDSETFTEFQASPTLTRQTVRYLFRQR